ncbi:MAG: hypothetical protein ACYTBZ_20500 [Planctomycetota bacterium]|jgi:hypothetical protein
MSETEAPPTEPTKTRYRLHVVPAALAIVSLIGFMWLGFIGKGLDGSSGIYAISYNVGTFLGIMILALALSWVSFRITRRSNLVGNVVFCIVFLIGLNVNPSASKTKKNQAALEGMQQRHTNRIAEIREKVEQGTYGGSEKDLDKGMEILNKAASESSGEQALIASAGAAAIRSTKPSVMNFSQLTNQLQTAGGINPTTLTSKQAVTDRLAIAKSLLEANRKLTDAVTNMPKVYRDELVRTHISAKRADELTRHFDSGAQIPLQKQLRSEATNSTKAVIGILQLLETQWGKWQFDHDSKQILFDFGEDVEQYQQLYKALAEAEKKHGEIQRRIFSTLDTP